MGIINIDLDNTYLDNNFDEDDLDNIILIGLLACNIKFEKRKALKDKWRINANSGILKVGEFLHVRRWEKRNLIFTE